jgi:hypothetical protein
MHFTQNDFEVSQREILSKTLGAKAVIKKLPGCERGIL